jgi:ABC-type uncharacterized transport system permease subunit
VALLLHQFTAVLYGFAVIAAGVGIAVASTTWSRRAVVVLSAGFVLHSVAFAALHGIQPTPALTELPLAVSLMAWIGTASYLLLLTRVRGVELVIVVAPLAFAGAFFASVALPGARAPAAGTLALWSHLHVLLASAGLALAGLGGMAGVVYLAHHRALKSKRRDALRVPLPSLEALDRVNAIALTTGFLLLTLGLLSGMAWVMAQEQRIWQGGLHADATLAAWTLYAVLMIARYGARLDARRFAASSAAGFAVLLLAVVGLGMLP